MNTGLGPGPHWFGVPPGERFAETLVRGLRERGGMARPEGLAGTLIWTNTRRSARALREAFERSGAILLPQIRAVAELDLRPGDAGGLQVRLELAALVTRLLDADPGLAPRAARFGLADALFDLFAELQAEGIGPAVLDTLDVGAFAEHWQVSRRFLSILAGSELVLGWFSPEQGLMAGARAEMAGWASVPADSAILIAGSTGSRAATRALMQAAANLPNGAVVLPGFDFGQESGDWTLMTPDHPQFGFRHLLSSADPPLDPAAVRPWSGSGAGAAARNSLLTLALKPAEATRHWIDQGRAFAPRAAAATRDLALLEAEDEGAEALAIAAALREAAESGGTAALVTPSAGLSRRVAAILARWGITPDFSAGTPLGITPPGVFLRLTAGLDGRAADPASLIAVLAHPLAGGTGAARLRHLAFLRHLERRHLRGGPYRLAPEDLRIWSQDAPPDLPGWQGWLDWLGGALLLSPPETCGIGRMAAGHRALAESLSAGCDGGGMPLWDRSAGVQARAVADRLAAAAGAVGLEVTRRDYAALLDRELAGAEALRDPGDLPDPRIAIWGTLEARTQHADLIILGGLNEGTWPAQPDPGPWLNAGMRVRAGLAPTARRIGLSAHDFQQAALAPRVILCRARREGGAPSVAARWLQRLTSLLRGIPGEGTAALEAMRARGDRLLSLVRHLPRRLPGVPPERRPAPVPPAGTFPGRLSVSDAELLIDNPYAFYARRVLRLSRLEPPGTAADAIQRGKLLHRVMEIWVRSTLTRPGDLTPEGLIATARQVLEAGAPWPAARSRWLGALSRNAATLVAAEIARQDHARPAMFEQPGELGFSLGGEALTLTARPDRIDRAADGSLIIYDYKAGGVPERKDIARGSAKQLVFEAAMALRGAFGDMPPAIAALAYLSITADPHSAADPATIGEEWDRFLALLARFRGQQQEFVARLKGDGGASEYDHLARLGEWRDGDPAPPEAVVP